jgi:hypothetical protein
MTEDSDTQVVVSSIYSVASALNNVHAGIADTNVQLRRIEKVLYSLSTCMIVLTMLAFIMAVCSVVRMFL